LRWRCKGQKIEAKWQRVSIVGWKQPSTPDSNLFASLVTQTWTLAVNHLPVADLKQINPSQIENLMTYRVLNQFLALMNEPHQFKTILEGKTITLLSKPLGAGLVDASYEGEVVAVFMIDIRKHCEPVEEKVEPKALGSTV